MTTSNETWSTASHENGVAPDTARLFGLDQVKRIDLVVTGADFDTMRENLTTALASDETPMWVDATVHYDERRWEHVGLRYRGAAAIKKAIEDGWEKFPFRLEFDQFEDEYPDTKNQRFYGYKRLDLQSNVDDPSYVRELLAFEALADGGAVAPLAAPIAVYVDHGNGAEYFGLYTLLEDPNDDAFRERNYGDSSGNLYEADGTGATFQVFVESSFEKKNHEEEADFSDVQRAITALNDESVSGASYRAALESAFDVDGFLRFLAVNTLIVGADSYGCKSSNYWLYGDPTADGRLSFIPWDLADSFQGSIGSCGDGTPDEDTPADFFHETRGDQWPLITRVLADEVYLASYTNYLEEAASRLGDAAFAEHVAALRALIAPFVDGDSAEVAPYTSIEDADEFEACFDNESGIGAFMAVHVASCEDALGN